MGLDMYLSGKVRSYKPYNEAHDPVRDTLVQAANAIGLPESDNIDFIELSRGVAYWRKANQVHAWFVKNVQDGKDDCGHYDVSREQLAELSATCQRVLNASKLVDGDVEAGYTYGPGGERKPIIEKGKVIADPTLAKELLPVQSGFFFGGTGYDQWYVSDLESTVKMIDRALTMPEHVDFEYHSSW